jgi:putative PIN family toxin of toxin-antitoxin system
LKIVLDTNVLVCGILSPNGPPAAVLRALLTERVTLCFDERIVSEYRDVLTRTRFSFDPDLVEELIGFLESAGSPTLAAPLAVTLPDPWDQMFIEVAATSNADCLVSGNLKHFPETARAGVRVVSPREFLDVLLEGN